MLEEDTATEDEVSYSVFAKKGRKHFAPQLVSPGTTTATDLPRDVKGVWGFDEEKKEWRIWRKQ